MDKYLGKRLDGRYEMRELIGVGGMAYVYKAYDAVDDRTVAVKILKDEFLNSEEFVRRFRNESKALAILNHPNIVKVLDVGFGERLQYIVMEYIDGITLKEYLDQRKDIRWKEAVHFTMQILRALQHAHDKGIVHRDIKPQNIMLLSDGTIKVTDFGIARLSRNEVRATSEGNKAIGSVHYISPEQARGEITDEKTDLYSVGIMLYEMLTGCLPFEADNAVSVAIMQMQSEAKAPHLINEEIPEGLEQITLKAMQKDTSKRYQSAAEMLSDFDEFKRNPSIKFEYTYMEDETPTRYVDAITRVRGETQDPAPKKEEPSTPKKNKKDASMLVFLLIAAVLTIGAVIWVLISIFGKPPVEIVEVDKFIGMHYESEIQNNEKYTDKFVFKIIVQNAKDPKRAAGEVFKQDPAAGSEAKKGATITLYVNDDAEDTISVDVRTQIQGEPKDDIRDLLEKKGFVVTEVSQSDDTIPADHVISVNVEAGTPLELGKQYPYGTPVKMNVSSGPSTADPIDFPPILGRDVNEAIDFLKSVGFTGNIDFKIENYTGTTAVAKNKVMAIEIGGERKNPVKEDPGVAITLIASTGLKDAVVQLEWPKTELMIDVQVIANGRVDSELSQKFANGIKPQYTTEKLSFTMVNHPVDTPYSLVVEVRESNSGKAFQMYANLQIDPVIGTVTVVSIADYLEGISPNPPQMVTIPAEFLPTTMSKDDVKNMLEGLGFTVNEQFDDSEQPEGTVLFVENAGTIVYAGDSYAQGTTFIMHVSRGPAPVDGNGNGLGE